LKIKIIFLGRASEIMGRSLIVLDLPENTRLIELIKIIGEKYNPVFYDRYVKGHYIYVPYINGKPVIDPNYVIKESDHIVFITQETSG